MWLEEAWADWLSSQGQTDAAINHFIEAGVLDKAVEAAIRSNQWQKAIQLVEDTMTDEETARPFYLRIAQHYASSLNFSDAERCYLKADRPELAVKMYTAANRWDEAHSVAMSYMSEREVASLYVSQARRMEATGNLEQAEKLYLKVKEADLAINMYVFSFRKRSAGMFTLVHQCTRSCYSLLHNTFTPRSNSQHRST